MQSLRIICLFLLIFVYDCALSQALKVMTYNIRYDNPGDGINSWPNRKEKVYDLLKKYNPDILGVQEALEHQIKDIIQALPEYDYIGVGRDDGKTKGEYSAILFKKKIFSIVKENTFWLSETPQVPGSKNWDAAITRIVTWGKFKHLPSGKEFYAINTHFDHIGTEARRNSAMIIKKEITGMNDAPVIVTGDFNCTRKDPPYQVMISKEGMTLTDPAPQNPPGTFCNFGVNSMECNPIDYVFHSNHWRASDYKVITDNDGKNYPSDHLPVVLSLQFTK
jgi:endonuclease/exonuclease/phosphatase family metal-dependent hydrolase